MNRIFIKCQICQDLYTFLGTPFENDSFELCILVFKVTVVGKPGESTYIGKAGEFFSRTSCLYLNNVLLNLY